MKPSQDLFDLVHALSPSEKRYFRLFVGRQSGEGENNYLRIFDALLAQADYDENALKAHFAGAKLLDNFPSEKNYLYHLILRAMRSFHAGKSPARKLQEGRADLDFLAAKGLGGPIRKQLKRAKAQAEKKELFSEWLQLLAFERRYVKLIYVKDLAGHLARIAEERKEVRRRMDNELDLLELYDQCVALSRIRTEATPGEKRAAVMALQAQPNVQILAENASFNAQSCFHLCNALCTQMLGQPQEALVHWKANVSHWQRHPDKVREEVNTFRRAIANYLNACRRADNHTEFDWGLAVMSALPQRTVQERRDHFANYHFTKLLTCINRGNFEAAEELLPEIEIGLQKYQRAIWHSRVIVFHYNILLLHFFRERPSQALQSGNRILHENFGEVRQDAQLLTRFLLLPIHFDLGNVELWEHLSGGLRRAIRKLRTLTEMDQMILRMFREVYREGKVVVNNAEARAWVESESSQQFEELRIWFRARMARQTLAESYQENL